jgi:hypothetical protein
VIASDHPVLQRWDDLDEREAACRIINVLEVENHGLRAGTGRTGQLVALPSANHR